MNHGALADPMLEPPGAARSGRGRGRDDGGQVAGIEVLPFGLLIFVIGGLVIVNLWAVLDVKIAADAASREGVRAYVEAPDAASGAARARQAAVEVIEGHGRRADRVTVAVTHDGGRPFARCVPATVTVTYPVPAVRLPWVGGLGHAFEVRARHTERIDPYRSGLAGSARC